MKLCKYKITAVSLQFTHRDTLFSLILSPTMQSGTTDQNGQILMFMNLLL